jgi:hypothetical protein
MLNNPHAMNLYFRAIRAAKFVPVRPKDPNEQYLTDLHVLGLETAELPSDNFDEPIRLAVKNELNGWDQGYFVMGPGLKMINGEKSDRTFHWSCSALGNYTSGHIVISAENVTEAAIRAVLQVRQWLDENRQHWFDDLGSPKKEYAQAYSDFWIKLFDDLRKVPDRDRTIIIEGSE